MIRSARLTGQWSRQRVIALLVLLAVLWAPLAPVFASAHGRAADGIWMELCSEHGAVFVQLADDEDAAHGGHHGNGDGMQSECPFCRLQATTALLPSILTASQPAWVGMAQPRTTLSQTAPPGPEWQPPPSRGPPSRTPA